MPSNDINLGFVFLDGYKAALARHGIALVRVMRPWDSHLWPLATHGFFRFREAVMR